MADLESRTGRKTEVVERPSECGDLASPSCTQASTRKRLTQIDVRSRYCHFDLNMMVATIVYEADHPLRLFNSIADDTRGPGSVAALMHVNVKERLAVAVVDVEGIPSCREEGIDVQSIDLQAQAEQ